MIEPLNESPKEKEEKHDDQTGASRNFHDVPTSTKQSNQDNLKQRDPSNDDLKNIYTKYKENDIDDASFEYNDGTKHDQNYKQASPNINVQPFAKMVPRESEPILLDVDDKFDSGNAEELKSLINDDQAISLKRKFGDSRKVVLDFSKGNNQAKIIVYDHNPLSKQVDKRSKMRKKIIKSRIHRLANGTKSDFVNHLHETSNVKLQARVKPTPGNTSSGSQNYSVGDIKEDNSTKRGLMLTQGNKQRGSLLRKFLICKLASNTLIAELLQ